MSMKAIIVLSLLAWGACGLSLRPSKLSSLSMTNSQVFKSVIPPRKDAVIIPPSYNFAAGCAALGLGTFIGFHNFIGVPIAAFGVLIAVQTGRVRFMFDKVKD